MDETVLSFDCAFKDLDTSDYVAGHAWGRLGADKYLLSRDCRRMDFPTTVAAVRAMANRHPEASAKYIEDKANGPAVIQVLRHTVPGLIAVNPEGGKLSRAAAVSPQIEAGNVYLPHPAIAPWVDEFVEQFSAFPNAAHDDDVDAATQSLLKLGANESKALFPSFSRAVHVRQLEHTKDYWTRWLSFWWEPSCCAAIWWIPDDRKRIHIYREYSGSSVDGMGAEDFSAEVALRSEKDLAEQQQIHASISPELFERNMGIRSLALQIEAGFKRVLGDNGGFVWSFTDDERMMESDRAYRSLEERQNRSANARIFVQAVKGDETTAWEYLRHLLRTGPLVPLRPVPYDRTIVDALCDINDNKRLKEYYDRVEGRITEEYPKLFVLPECIDTADAMLSARRGEKDASILAVGPYKATLQALALGALAHRDRQAAIPKEEFVARRLDRLQTDDPMTRVNVAKKAERDYHHQHRIPGPIRFERNNARAIRKAVNREKPQWSNSPGSF
jgi:predicted phage terminase large subunit-like protein